MRATDSDGRRPDWELALGVWNMSKSGEEAIKEAVEHNAKPGKDAGTETSGKYVPPVSVVEPHDASGNGGVIVEGLATDPREVKIRQSGVGECG